MSRKRRYAQVGLGSRAVMYGEAVLETYAESAELVGLCDSNAGRLRLAAAWARSKGAEAPGYAAEEFDRMVAEREPDCVIVTSKDCTHDAYICRAMELGCDVITEKPLTTDEEKCQRIIDTQRRTGRQCRVTFNYRYAPATTQLKELLMSGVVGDVVAVDFQWLLNTHHGADYFRRWHRRRENSGSLLVHKATHHFDAVNWWLSSVPERVFATGQRRFYTPEMAERYGLTERAERCLGCAEAGRCNFHLDLRRSRGLRELYLENEEHDGYFRDRCVFSGEIDIWDSMQMIAEYASGAKMAYSLHAFMPWEGFVVAFSGTKGRLEHRRQETVYISGDGTVPGELVMEGTRTRVYPHFRPAYEVEVWTAEGGHGGGDPVMLEDIFGESPPADRYLRAADQRAGAYSVLTGVAAYRSIDGGRPVRIDELVTGIGMPDYPPMPSAEEPVVMEKETARVVSPEEVERMRAARAEEAKER